MLPLRDAQYMQYHPARTNTCLHPAMHKGRDYALARLKETISRKVREDFL